MLFTKEKYIDKK